jgi:rhamnose transport system permease protein
MTWARRLGRWEAMLLILLVGLLVVGGSISPFFLDGQNLSLALADSMALAVMALPMALIIITGQIDLSVASVLAFTAALSAWLSTKGVSLPLALMIGLAAGAGAGALNGFFISALGLPSLLVTLGTLALFRGIAHLILRDQAVSTFPTWFTDLGAGVVPGTQIPWTVVVFVALAVVFGVALHATGYGRKLYAIGFNAEASRYSGIRERQITFWLFVVSGAIAALAGWIQIAYLASVRSDIGAGGELVVITIVLLGGASIFGGRGTIGGVVLAVVILALLRNLLGLRNVSSEAVAMVMGGLLIFSVLAGAFMERLVQRWHARRAEPVSPMGPHGRRAAAS